MTERSDLWRASEAQLPYVSQPEDGASGFFGVFFFSWLNPVMRGVSQERIQSPHELPGPIERFRVLTTGRQLARALAEETAQRHAWDGFIGSRVRLHNVADDAFFPLHEDADAFSGAHGQSLSGSTEPVAQVEDQRDPATRTGVLKYIGYVHSFRTPHRLYAGIAWDTGYAPPPQASASRCGTLTWWLRCLSCGCARRVPRALCTRLYHDGTVGEEPLFSIDEEVQRAASDGNRLEEAVVLATCEPVEFVQLCLAPPPAATETAEARTSSSSASSSSPRQAESSSSSPPLPPPTPRPVSLTSALFRALGPLLWVLGPLRILASLIAMVAPLVLKRYLRYLRADGSSEWGEGLWLVFVFFATSMAQNLVFTKFEQAVTRCALAFRGALCAIVMEKCLTIAPKYLQLPSLHTGRILNMISNDVQQAQAFCYLFWYTLCAPLQIAGATYMVCQMVGTRATLVALAVYAVFMPVELLLSRVVHYCYVKRITATDARLKRTEEFFSGIRIAKFMSWEPFFVTQVERCRAEEMRWLRITQWMWTAVNLLTSFVPTLATAAMFTALMVWPTDGPSGSFLTPETIFPALSALALLEAPFNVIPVLLYGYVRFYIAMSRLAAFVECDDAQPIPPVVSPSVALQSFADSGERVSERASRQLWTDLSARFVGATITAFQPVPVTSLRSEGGSGADGGSEDDTSTTTSTDDGGSASSSESAYVSGDDVSHAVPTSSTSHPLHHSSSAVAVPLSRSSHALHLDDNLPLRHALAAAASSDGERLGNDRRDRGYGERTDSARDVGIDLRAGDPSSSSRTSQHHRRRHRRRATTGRAPQHGYFLKPLSILHDVTVDIPEGSLTVVVGATGSGRSTFLKSLLGAHEATRGALYVTPSIAYVSQPVWILGGTVRENVVFFADSAGKSDGSSWRHEQIRQEQLRAALSCTQLLDEMEQLPQGLDTEIGERGANLSGGQKARVSLARAVYADKELYLLDDPLSALDAHVGERVMHECILGALAGKTRVVTLHQAAMVHHAHYVIYLQNGHVAFHGSYPAYKRFAQNRANWFPHVLGRGASNGQGDGGGGFLEHASANLVSRVDLAAISAAHSQVASHVPSDTDDDAGAAREAQEDLQDTFQYHNDSAAATEARTPQECGATDAERTANGVDAHDAKPAATSSSSALWVIHEERATGRVPSSVYWRYIEACGGVCMLVVVSFVFLLTECATQSSSLFLSLWSTHTFDDLLSPRASLTVYLGCVFLGALSFSVRYGVCLTYARRGARKMHRACLCAVGSSAIAFFDRTPVGQLMNRFSRDINIIDDDLQMVLLLAISMFVGAVAHIALLLVSQYFIVFFLIPTVFLFMSIARFYSSAARHVQRMVNTANTPLLTHLQEILTGRWVIHAFDKDATFLCEALRRIDDLFACDYMRSLGECWLSIRMAVVSSLLLTGMALLGVLSKHSAVVHLNVGLLALSLTSARKLSSLLTSGVMSVADVEAGMNSVERLLHCIDTAEPEAVLPDNKDISTQSRHPRRERRRRRHRAAADTPFTAGSLEFRHVDMRYREGLPLVLRDVSFVIERGQKVGVVGRTGSGKSTLLLAFLRLVEVCGGSIVVNGRDASDYELRELRLLFSMIPQDPLLFDGTVRSNVDPFGECSDGAVWDALRHVGMSERVRGEAGGLDCRVQEGGSNFSVGQRQLLCLARALLKRGSAFLLMDEATANVDPALDRQIQQTVHDVFAAYTVVTIAHRLHTVARYDVIIVMDGGRVLEVGSPRELALRADSHFAGLVRSMGEKQVQSFMTAAGALS